MKKAIALLVLLTVCVVSVFAFSNESEYSYTYVPLQKIYTHQEGYIALYTLDGYNMKAAYLPVKWFGFNETRGKLIDLPKNLNPYMVVVYKNNEFQYVTLAVPRNRGDFFWGVTPSTTDVAGKFDVEEVVIK